MPTSSDNHANFRGGIPPPWQHFSPIVATCLDLRVTPRFIPRREPWRNGVVEHFNDVWDKWYSGPRSSTTSSTSEPPTRLPAKGRIEVVRFVHSNRRLDLFGKRITVAEDRTHQYVTATIKVRSKRVNIVTLDGEIIHDGAFNLARTLRWPERCAIGQVLSCRQVLSRTRQDCRWCRRNDASRRGVRWAISRESRILDHPR